MNLRQETGGFLTSISPRTSAECCCQVEIEPEKCDPARNRTWI
jgi:hypothetical protein